VIIIVRVAQTSKKFQVNKSSNLPSKSSGLNLNSHLSNSNPLKNNKSEALLSVLGNDLGSKNNNGKNNNGVISKSPSSASGFNIPMVKHGSSKKAASYDDKFSLRTRNLALMLIPVNILFLMFMAPVVITMYIYENLFDDKLTLAIVELLSYCNFSINFIIYFLTSSKFREEFFKLMNECSLKLKCKNTNISHLNTTNVFTYNSKSLAIEKNTIKNNSNIQSNKTENDPSKHKLNIPLITINKENLDINEDQDKMRPSLFKCLQESYNETNSLMEKNSEQHMNDIRYLDDDDNHKETEFKQ
jgi:hypothetical protein